MRKRAPKNSLMFIVRGEGREETEEAGGASKGESLTTLGLGRARLGCSPQSVEKHSLLP